MNTRLITVAFALAVLPTALLAEDSPAPASPAADTAAVDEEMPAGTGVTGEKGKETLSVDFPNAEIRTILRNIADLFDLNLVIPETLEGRASLKLRDVTWRQIFDVLLNPIGYTYVTDGNIIKIVTQESLNVEPAETRIYVLNYARAAEIAPTVSSMIEPAKGGKLQVETRSNALVVTERPKRLEKVGDIIARLDRATDQVMIETKFVEVTDRDLDNLGINWASLENFDVTLDVTPTLIKGGGISAIRNPDGELIQESKESSTAFGAVLDAGKFGVVLSALASQSQSRLVSNPTVVTLNNQEAEIAIAEEFPIPSYTYNQERGTFEVSGFEYKPIGIVMKVTPQVNSRGLINLKIAPEVSSRTGETTFGGAGNTATIPIITTRRTSTQVAIMDGYTLGLGGLMESTITDTNSKVPLLGDIPGLGQLFRSKGKKTDKRNLIVFITAKVLSPEGASYQEVFSQAQMDEMGVTEADAPGAK